MDLIRGSIIGAGIGLCLAGSALAAPPARLLPAASLTSEPRLPMSKWPTALLCRLAHKKAKADGTEGPEMVTWGEWSYLQLAPSISGHFVYARGPLYHANDEKPPKDDFEQTNVRAVFNADGSSAGSASGDCNGRSILSLIASGQTR